MESQISTRITSGYNGRITVTAHINGIEHRIDSEEVTRVLEKALTERGYIITKSNQQKYPRITIND